MKTPQAGFSVLEIIIVIVILVLLSTLTFVSFSNLNKHEILDKEALHVLSLIHEARSLTLSSREDSQYGVNFESDKMTLFKGASYSPGDPDNKIISIHPQVRISSIVLNGGGTAMIFKRLSGTTDNHGTTTLSLVGDTSQTKDITIFSTGIAEIR
jgi:prepilin-type N-terminal cleavage/methylation domain-containing protein